MIMALMPTSGAPCGGSRYRSDKRRADKVEREVDELARVHPEVDDAAIAREVG